MAKTAASKYIKMIKPVLALYSKVLEDRRIKLEALYVFGSFAKGTPHLDSDIDVAVVSESLSGDPIDDFVLLAGFRRGIDERIEPHPFRPEDFTEDNPEAAEIMRTGIRIL